MNAPEQALPARKDSLWWLTASPTIWVAHFLACYITAAVFCAKAARYETPLAEVRWAIAGFTVVGLAGVAVVGFRGWRRHRFGGPHLSHDDDTPADRHRFLGFATLLLSGLSAVGIVFVALPAVFMGTCR